MGITRAREKLDHYPPPVQGTQMTVRPGISPESQCPFLRSIRSSWDMIGNVYRPSRKARTERAWAWADCGPVLPRLPDPPASGSGDFGEKQPSTYDPVRFAKQQVKKNVSADTFEIGDNVSHGKFGHGIVVDATAHHGDRNIRRCSVRRSWPLVWHLFVKYKQEMVTMDKQLRALARLIPRSGAL